MSSKSEHSAGGNNNNNEKTRSRNLFALGVGCDFNKNNCIISGRNIQTQHFVGSVKSNTQMACKAQPLISNKDIGECSEHKVCLKKLKCASVLKSKTSCVTNKSQSKVKVGYPQTPKKQMNQTLKKHLKVSPKIKNRPKKYFGSKSLHVFSNQVEFKNYFKCIKYKTVSKDTQQISHSNEKNADVQQISYCDRKLGGIDVNRYENSEEKMADGSCINMHITEECSDEKIILSQEIQSPSNYSSSTGDSYNLFLKEVLFDYLYTINFSDVEDFLTCEEQSYVSAVTHIQLSAQRLYARLLARKHNWIRISSMKYGNVSKNLNDDLETLTDSGLIITDYTSERLQTLLNLLKVLEIKALCKHLHLKINGNKENLITSILSVGNQPTINQYFSLQQCGNKEHIISKLSELLGSCIKVTDNSRQSFMNCLIFFSYPHYRGLERERFNEQLRLINDRRRGSKIFPDYIACRTKIFKKKKHFHSYAAALLDRSNVLEAIEKKKWNDVVKLVKEIVDKYVHLDEEEKQYAESLPDYLRYFTAGSCYVSTINKTIHILRSKAGVNDAKNYIQLLLNQTIFHIKLRGYWYENLALLFQESLKDNVQAAEVILKGLQDETVGTVARQILSVRGELLIKRKKDGLNNTMKEMLKSVLESPLKEPPRLTISGFTLPNTQQGYKQIYLQNSCDGQELTSVEEVAKTYFLSQGYKYGRCDEGQTIKSLILVCFWDIIYDHTFDNEESVFHSQCQKAPLDWNTDGFYSRRRFKIENRLKDMAEGGVEKIFDLVTWYTETNMNKQSVVNWSYLDNLMILKGLIEAVGSKLWCDIAKLLLADHSSYSAGFPDLTLWDPYSKKCLFVEVKGRNDQLSVKQKLWMHNLMKFSAHAYVCHVTSAGSKIVKEKASSSETSKYE